MRLFKWLTLAICSITLSTTGLSNVIVKSRNMPTHCEFVYNVFSEVEIIWPNGKTDALLRHALYDEYTDAWVEGEDVVLSQISANQASPTSLLLSFESMSTSKHFLFRVIRFQTEDLITGELSRTYVATFGREFGEKCYYPDRLETPFRERRVDLLPAQLQD